MRNNKQHALALVAASLLAGCAAQKDMMKSVDDDFKARGDVTTQKRAEITQEQVRPLVTRSAVAWVGGKNVELSRDAALPPAFSKEVTMIFPGRVNLRTAAERLNKVTGIPVRLKPDVFMPTSMFIGGAMLGGIPGQMPGQLAGQVPVPAAVPPGVPGTPGGLPPLPSPLANSMYAQVQNTADEIEINYTGQLSGFLNQMCSRFGINWEYSPENGIVFSRMVTKVMVLKANPGDSTFTASLGKGGSASASGGSFSSDGQIKMNSTFSVWEGLQKSLESIKSAAGKYNVNQGTGTVTITDTREVVDLAKKIIDTENAMLTKQVAIRLDMYSITSSDDVQSGVDWNLVYQKFTQGVTDWSLNLVSPSTVTTSLAGSLGLSIVAPATSSSAVKNMTGSDALLHILQGMTRVSKVQSVSAMTLNRQPVPIGVTNQLSYLAKTTPGTTGTGTTTLPGLEPGMVTTGFLTNLLPTVLDNNSILLQFSIDLSEMAKMGIISTGSGATLQSIQTPEVNAVQFVQRVALRPGSTLVLTGFERNKNGYDQRGLTKDVGLGGTVAGSKTRDAMVIMITPTLVDGAS